MPPIERPFNGEEQQDLDLYTSKGFERLQASSSDAPEEIVATLRQYLDEHRHVIAGSEPDDYADAILALGYLWGEQVCRAYGWEWVTVNFGGGEGPNVVAPDRRACIQPLWLVKDIVDASAKSNNTLLLFNMLVPERLQAFRPFGYQALS